RTRPRGGEGDRPAWRRSRPPAESWGRSWSTAPGGRCICSRRTSRTSRPAAAPASPPGGWLFCVEKAQPTQSACSGACVAAWPVDQSSGTPKVGSGVKASLLGTIKRGDGSTQVTYNKHPLYYYSGDSQPGQQNGQGVNAFGATWFVVAPAGAAVSGGATATTAGGYGSSGYGGVARGHFLRGPARGA